MQLADIYFDLVKDESDGGRVSHHTFLEKARMLVHMSKAHGKKLHCTFHLWIQQFMHTLNLRCHLTRWKI